MRPATVEIVFADEAKTRITLPAETWMLHGSHEIVLEGTRRVANVTIDPDHVLPDVERANNVMH